MANDEGLEKLGKIMARLEVMMDHHPKKNPYAPPIATIPRPTDPEMRGIIYAAAKYYAEWMAEMDEIDLAEIKENDSWDDFRGDSITVVNGGWPHPYASEMLDMWLDMTHAGLLP